MATAGRNITTTGQIGDGREDAAVNYVLANAQAGDIDDVLAKMDKFGYEKSILINVGDEKGVILDAAVQRANPTLALELGTYCGYGALRIARLFVLSPFTLRSLAAPSPAIQYPTPTRR